MLPLPFAIIPQKSGRLPSKATNLLKRHRAFTLIEMLVVIALIAILALVASWGIGSVMNRAADTQDLNNLRQIGAAISTFAAENNGRIPNLSLTNSFMESVDRMLPQDSKFTASSSYNWVRRPIWFSKRFAKAPPGKTYPKTQYYWGQSWGMNSHLWGNSGSANMVNFNGYLIRAPNLSKLVLVGEKNRQGGHDFKPAESPVFEKDVETNYRISRGSGGTNNRAYYLFADYHIESIAGDQSSRANPAYNSYNPTNRLYYRW